MGICVQKHERVRNILGINCGYSWGLAVEMSMRYVIAVYNI